MKFTWPFEFRVGSTGLFCPGIYCGIGVAYGRELSVAGLPGVGQIHSSFCKCLAGFDSIIGGGGSQVRRRVRSSGMKGVDAGLMCGFGVGYGFGAGLVLKPSALHALQLEARTITERVAAAVQSRLPPQLAHLVEHPGRESLKSLPTLQRHMPALAAQAGSTSEPHLAEFSLSNEAALSLHLPQARRNPHLLAEGRDPQVHHLGSSSRDSAPLTERSHWSANNMAFSTQEQAQEGVHITVEQPDMQEFTAALKGFTASLAECTSSIKEATLELKQASAALRQSHNGS
ncbi:g2142 [Coccomyxa elongata]